MKIEELFEMPEFIDKEMPVVMSGTMRFYSEDTIKRDFDSIGKVKVNDEEVWSILKKDKSFAVIGILSVRKEDKKIGLNLIGKLEFKSKLDLSYDEEILTSKNVLQVDVVEVYSKEKANGFGYNLYLSLIEYGFVLISDHTQYIGGRKLWEKLARFSGDKFDVYVIDNGNVILDDSGSPLKYDGKNITDEKIWKTPAKSAKDSTRYVLLAMKKK